MNAKLEKDKYPYYEREAECPVCGKISTHLYLKDKVYTVNKREEDLFVSSYRWAKNEYNHYNLYYFYFWHCPNCKFTEERSEFLKSKTLQAIKPNYVIGAFKQKAANDNVISHLTQHIHYPHTDYLSVLTLHLLAIYIQQLPDIYQRDLEKIARYYLRTSWIYHLESGNNRTGDENIFFEEYMKQYEVMQAYFLNALAGLEDLNQWLEEQISVEREQNRGGWINQEKSIKSTYSNITRNLNRILNGLQEYYTIGLNYKKYLGTKIERQTVQKYYEYDSYMDFLFQIKNKWSSLPLSEYMAIKKAIHFYHEIVRSRIFDAKKMKLFNTYKLLAYLSVKVGDYADGIKILDQLKRKVISYRDSANRRLQRLKKIKDDRIDENLIKEHIQKSNELINYINFKRAKYLEEKIALDMTRAKKLFNDHRNLPPEALEQLLVKEKICPEVIAQFISERKKKKRKEFSRYLKFNIMPLYHLPLRFQRVWPFSRR